jgi:hypothetical protein
MSNDVITELRACLDATAAFSAERGRAVVVGAMALIASQVENLNVAVKIHDELHEALDESQELVASQAAEIERLRGRIQIAGGTLVAWLRKQGGGVDPVRHALAILRAAP